MMQSIGPDKDTRECGWAPVAALIDAENYSREWVRSHPDKVVLVVSRRPQRSGRTSTSRLRRVRSCATRGGWVR